MRPDKPKQQAQHKSGAKDQKKDLEARRQPRAASREAPAPDETAVVKARHADRKGGPTLH